MNKDKAVEIVESIINEHVDEVWEYYKDGYWDRDDFRNEPEDGNDCIESFRKWDFDQYLNGAYHYGFVLGLEEAIRQIRNASEE
jgi:hypothetical protein|tara:strand:+ start:8096 stop:8347 length:252 start_codon:yes stop_codon:yes gene_type:complete